MPTLVICGQNQLSNMQASADIVHTGEPRSAQRLLETEDIDRIVFDTRMHGSDSDAALVQLIAMLPVTTRLLAIVERLPRSPLCANAGVVYLTPPVRTSDIAWFIGLNP